MMPQHAYDAIANGVNMEPSLNDGLLGPTKFEDRPARWTRGNLTVTLSVNAMNVFFQPGRGAGAVPVRLGGGDITDDDVQRTVAIIVGLLNGPGVGA